MFPVSGTMLVVVSAQSQDTAPGSIVEDKPVDHSPHGQSI